jgi:hypothetical protein
MERNNSKNDLIDLLCSEPWGVYEPQIKPAKVVTILVFGSE